MPQIIWQTYRRTPREAVEEFARTYWDKPRQIIWLDHGRFQVEDGIRTYRVVYDSNSTSYQIQVVN